MLSVVICSRKPDLLKEVSANIRQTAGVEVEIVVIDNQTNQYSICEAYNRGASQSRFPYLCFSHEDLIFHTKGWGQKLIQILENQRVGVVGVIGSRFQPAAPAAWWDTGLRHIRSRIRQRYPDRPTSEEGINPQHQALAQVITLDGLWLGCRREVWAKYPFDETTFTDFHLYDHDFSLQIAQYYENYVTFEILIEHFSLGTLDNRWRDNLMKFYQKWKNKLPLCLEAEPETTAITARIFRNFVTKLIENQYNQSIVLPYALRSCWLAPADRQNWWFMVWLFEQYFPSAYVRLRQLYRFWKK